MWKALCRHTSSSRSTDLKSAVVILVTEPRRLGGSVAGKDAENWEQMILSVWGLRNTQTDIFEMLHSSRMKTRLSNFCQLDADVQTSQEHILFVSLECFSVFVLVGCGFFFIHCNSSHGNSKRGQTRWVCSCSCCFNASPQWFKTGAGIQHCAWEKSEKNDNAGQLPSLMQFAQKHVNTFNSSCRCPSLNAAKHRQLLFKPSGWCISLY